NNNEGYMNYYSTSYNDYIAGLNRYSIYDTPESINNQFKDKEYLDIEFNIYINRQRGANYEN
ncbi:hypothetical protein ACTPEF_25580, partial [Clostridioides difficile]